MKALRKAEESSERVVRRSARLSFIPSLGFQKEILANAKPHREFLAAEAAIHDRLGSGDFQQIAMQHQGWLWKEGFYNKTYSRRFFRLKKVVRHPVVLTSPPSYSDITTVLF
jgi:hypothetical protein